VSKSALFAEGGATDPSYINVRDARNAHAENIRTNCQEFWEVYEPYADKEFLTEIRSNFDARYWEMYLTTYLLREGYEVYAPKPGPDVGIRYKGCRIWFEATCPERGADDNPDQVPDLNSLDLANTPRCKRRQISKCY